MHIDFPKARHVHSLNNIQREAAWTTKISHAVQAAQNLGRTHILIVFTKRECEDQTNGYLFERFIGMSETLASMEYIVQVSPIPQGYSFLMSWGHHARATE